MQLLVRMYACIRMMVLRIFRDDVFKEASALAYQSFMAIVPLLAILFGIAKGFGLESFLTKYITEELQDHKEALQYLLQFSSTTLHQAQGGLIAGLGIFFLFLTIMRLLASVERALTRMWGFPSKGISCRRFFDYLALLIICPMLLAISSSATIFVSAQVSSFFHKSALLSTVPEYLDRLLSFIPFVTTGALFTVLLYVVPNAPVRFFCALGAGFLMAFFFHHVQSWYIIIQLQFTKVSAIYGSFVALPLFLVWVWMSWFIFLLAGECTVFFQERGWRKDICSFVPSEKAMLAMQLDLYNAAKKAYVEQKPLSFLEMYATLCRPIFYCTQSVAHLIEKKVLLPIVSMEYTYPILPNMHGDTSVEVCILFPTMADISMTKTEVYLEQYVFQLKQRIRLLRD